MGLHTPYESLALRWAALCSDVTLHDLPFKVELNGCGTIEMSPASTRHARYQGTVAGELMRQLPGGTVLTECAIATAEDGVRVPDVAWASPAFTARLADATPLPQAPEICVDIRSPSNTDAEMDLKRRVYLAAGAVELWIVADDGSLKVFDAGGEQAASRFGVQLALDGPRQRQPE